MAVDIYGYPSELEDLQEILRARAGPDRRRVQALGARYRHAPVGAQGQDAVFAFYPNKQITTGEGGVVTTHRVDVAPAQEPAHQGRADGRGWLEHARLGFNYRLDDVRAAIGIGQLEKLDAILAARHEAAARYADLLDGVDGLQLPCDDDEGHVRSWFVYVVALPEGADRERVIGDRVHGRADGALPPVHSPPAVHARARPRKACVPWPRA